MLIEWLFIISSMRTVNMLSQITILHVLICDLFFSASRYIGYLAIKACLKLDLNTMSSFLSTLCLFIFFSFKTKQERRYDGVWESTGVFSNKSGKKHYGTYANYFSMVINRRENLKSTLYKCG